LITNEDKVSKWFLFYYLIALRNRLIALSVGSAQPNISSGIIKKLKIPKLSTKAQNYYVSRFIDIDKTANNIKSKISSSQALQKSLINQIFSN